MSYLNKQRSIAYITSIILTVYGYTLDDLIRKDRKKYTVEARNAFCFLSRKYLGMSYNDIGSIIKRDHTSVANAVRMFDLKRFLATSKMSEGSIIDAINSPGYQANVSNNGKWTRLFRERGGICEIPGCDFDDVLEVHHLISRKSGGTDEMNNVIVLCPNHHRMLHSGLLRLNPEKFPFLRLPEELSTKIDDSS